ncbi:polysaccharide deacetylase family protein [Nitrosarchaeum sp.]|uniref:polysaccharide deacetylase family protein n=1 Tax=Nitrosarchaeum sp. TaxID=2026886 RepID=UPI00247E15B5|nr:polysaccharide deacetylase family protein [Nitrosarchaeum sp.]MCV0411892.1 polysaccharide deacetylase family protein [Nitrosarchaeum sp.]
MNIIGIDFEDWFHPHLIKKHLTNEKKIPRIIDGIDKILELLRKTDTIATFFVVGELIEFRPEILDKILKNDHEIAFHSMYHDSLTESNEEKFNIEIEKFAKLTGKRSKGFRAPSFSLNYSTSWAINVLEKNDYEYDSSIVPAKTSMYGITNAQKEPYRISSEIIEKNNPSAKIIEYPLAVTNILGKKIPSCGGFYLRTLPMKVSKDTIKRYESNNVPATYYVHSWELTPELMPDISLPKKDHFITFHNIRKTFDRMNEILQNFEFTSFEKYQKSL